MTGLVVLVALLTLYVATLHVFLLSVPDVDPESTGVHRVR